MVVGGERWSNQVWGFGGMETVLAGISPRARVISPHPFPLFAGDSLLVAKGGKGGAGVKAPTREANQRDFHRQMKMAEVCVGGWGGGKCGAASGEARQVRWQRWVGRSGAGKGRTSYADSR